MTAGRTPENEEGQGRAFLARLLARMSSAPTDTTSWSVQLGVFTVLTVVVVGLGALSTVLTRPRTLPFEEQLRLAFEALDRGDMQTARRMAEALRIADVEPRRLGGPVFIQAAAVRHDAMDHWNPAEQRKLFLIASRYFEEARDRGWPEGREAEGWYYLAETLVRSGRYAESLAALQQAFQYNPSLRTKIHRLFAEAYFADEPPRYDLARTHIQEYLADNQLRPLERASGQLLLARILLGQGDAGAALTTLDLLLEDQSTPPSAPAPQELTKWERTQLAAIRRDGQVYRAYIRVQVADRTTPPDVSLYQAVQAEMQALREHNLDAADSEYLLAQVYRRLGDEERQREQLIRVARRFYRTPQGRAAAVELAEWYQRGGDYAQAADALVTSLTGDVPTAARAEGVPHWEDLKPRILRVYEKTVEAGQFPEAARLAVLLPSLLPTSRVLELQAEAELAWAQAEWRRALDSNYSQAAQYRRAARQHFRQAGRLYEELAKLRFAEREYSDYLWKAAECHVRAQHFSGAAATLERYLREEPRLRRPRALLLLGEALLALGNIPEAQRNFQYCYAAYRHDPDAYRARYRSAQALLEQGKLAESQQELLQNLEDNVLAPESAEWRDSLFLLGEVLHRQGSLILAEAKPVHWAPLLDEASRKKNEQLLERATEYFQQAVSRLTEAVQRYPDDTRSVLARYWLAENYRNLALLPAWKLPGEAIESRRAELARRIRTNYQAAYQGYDALARWLDEQQDLRELTPIEKAVHRNAYFGRAHTLYDMGDYRAAIDAYSSASNRYQNEPVCLEAYHQIAACYRKLGEPSKARGTLEQAKIVINRLPTNVDFSRTTRYPRDVWLQVLK